MYQLHYKQRNCLEAFTLAEVLVVLLVIGIISAFTIPSLIYRYDEKQLNTRWKKEFNVAVDAVKKLEANKNFIDLTSDATMRNDFKTVMHFLRESTWNSLSASTYYYYGGSSAPDPPTWVEESALMMNGSLWRFNVLSAGCNATVGGTLNNICAELTVDVNGTKGPNKYGKDLYFIHIAKVNSNYVVYPYGSNNDGQSCSDTSNAVATSRGCSTFFLINDPSTTPP